MKKSLLVLAVAMLSTVAFANDVVFETSNIEYKNGEIGQSNCTIATESKNKTVNLEKVYSNALREKGATIGGVRPFELRLTGCPVAYIDSTGEKKTSVAIKFTESSNIDKATGALRNTASSNTAANNVQLQMLNNDDEVINLSDNSGNTQVGTLSLENNEISFTFGAQYLSMGGTTPGKFETSVPFTFEYK